MNPYQTFVADTARLIREARTKPLGGFPGLPRPTIAADAPKVLVFSPHPDDEVVIGALPLRLLREARWQVINVAVTHGSNPARQAARWRELQACCAHIGFELLATREHGLDGINLRTRTGQPEDWRRSVDCIAGLLRAQQPRVIFFPHDADWNSTHIGTHHLLVDALRQCGNGFACATVETEFWGAMDDPNLMVESSEQDLTDLITALTFHVGEVQRNPYHLCLPAWMIDNVRRGGELVGGQGGGVPDFMFATLYRRRRWQGGAFRAVVDQGRFLAAADDPAGLFVD